MVSWVGFMKAETDHLISRLALILAYTTIPGDDVLGWIHEG